MVKLTEHKSLSHETVRRRPKHASWLNMVAIEIGVLRGQCLDRRIDDPKRPRREITAWQRRRNAARPRIKWMFTTDKARAKMAPRLHDVLQVTSFPVRQTLQTSTH